MNVNFGLIGIYIALAYIAALNAEAEKFHTNIQSVRAINLRVLNPGFPVLRDRCKDAISRKIQERGDFSWFVFSVIMRQIDREVFESREP